MSHASSQIIKSCHKTVTRMSFIYISFCPNNPIIKINCSILVHSTIQHNNNKSFIIDQTFIVDNHLDTMVVYEFYLTCGVIVVVELLLVFH